MNITVTLFAQVVAFIALIWFVNKVLWKPMNGLLEDRQKRISDGLAAAEKGKKEQELAEKKAKENLADAKKRAAEIVSQAQKRGSEIEEEAKVKAREEAERIIAAANSEIEQEINRAREALRKEVSTIAVAGASKVLKKEIDAKAHADLLNDLATQI